MQLNISDDTPTGLLYPTAESFPLQKQKLHFQLVVRYLLTQNAELH